MKDLALPGPHIHPVRWQEKEDPGLALVGRELPAALGHAHNEPSERRMRQDAREGALRGSEETSVGFEEGETHAATRRCHKPHSTYMMTTCSRQDVQP